MQIEFKYALGDLVQSVTARATAVRRTAVDRGPEVFAKPAMVVGRIAEECSGGVQIFYLISIDGDAMRVNEMEIEPYSEGVN